MADDSSPNSSRREYFRQYKAKARASKPKVFDPTYSILYYRQKKRAGLTWKPSPISKLSLWCKENGLDATLLIEGKQELPKN